MPLPVSHNDAYADLILLRDDYTDLARAYLALADRHLELFEEKEALAERLIVAMAYLKIAITTRDEAETRLEQATGLSPWHDVE